MNTILLFSDSHTHKAREIMSDKCCVLKHEHLIVRAEVNKPFLESDKETTKKWMSDLVSKIGMKIIGGPYVEYVSIKGNEGLTSCVLIETSHISLHVWSESKPALIQLDVYTCSSLELGVVFDHMKVMEPTKIEYKFLDRENGLKIVER